MEILVFEGGVVKERAFAGNQGQPQSEFCFDVCEHMSKFIVTNWGSNKVINKKLSIEFKMLI